MYKFAWGLLKVLAVIAVSGVCATVLHGQTYTTLYSFGTNPGDPKNPATNGLMSQGRDGNLYSTSNGGGSFGTGAAFTITTAGALTKLFDFNDISVGS